MALAFKLWWCPWGIRLGQRLPFGISYALMMVLLINSTELTALLWPSFHRLRCSFGNDCDKCDSPYRGRCWLKDCMRWLSFGTIGTRWSGGKPPLQGHNLGALLLDYFDLLASLALTVICQSFYNARFCWLPALVGLLTGFIIFWFAEPGQIKFCAAFPHWPFWLELLLFLHDCHIMATVVLFSSRRRRRASISGCCQESANDAVIVCSSSFCC